MTRTRRFAVLASFIYAATLTAAQKPNFTGTWIITTPAKAAGQVEVVNVNEKTASITAAGRTLVHQLDGVEHRETHAFRGGEIVRVERAAWDGNTIVITTTTDYPNKMKTVAKEIWSIDARGQFTIDYTETGPDGPPTVNKVIHTRKN